MHGYCWQGLIQIPSPYNEILTNVEQDISCGLANTNKQTRSMGKQIKRKRGYQMYTWIS